MADNFIDIPFLNPVKFYKVGRTNTNTYFTKHFDDFTYEERLAQLYWKAQNEYKDVWQTTDIISIQYESSFDPIILELRKYGSDALVATFPAQLKIANKFIAGAFAYETDCSLAGLNSGCYYLRLTIGSGLEQEVHETKPFYVSSTPVTEPNILIEYWSSHDYHLDVVFKTGIHFRRRLLGHFGFLKPGRVEERYRDQRYNPAILNAKPFEQFNLFFGDSFGLPDDVIKEMNFIFTCNNILFDGVPYGIADGSDFEFEDEQGYMKRGVKILAEPGINRYSKRIQVNTDTTKKLFYAINVEATVWGDTGNTGSSNTVPLINVQRE
jgi:hypothetical protein